MRKFQSKTFDVMLIQRRALEALRTIFGQDVVTAKGGQIHELSADFVFSFRTATPEQVEIILRGRFSRNCADAGLIPSDFDLDLRSPFGDPLRLIAIDWGADPPFTLQTPSGAKFHADANVFLKAREIRDRRRSHEKSNPLPFKSRRKAT